MRDAAARPGRVIDQPPGRQTNIRHGGMAQGVTLVAAGFLPLMAIVTLTSAVPTIAAHFGSERSVLLLVTVLLGAPGLSIAVLAPFAGRLADRYGRRMLLLSATLLYGVVGTAPFLLDNLYVIIGTRLLLGVAEAVILTLVNTLIGDYWDQPGRRRWLVAQGVAGPLFSTAIIAVSGVLTAWRWNAAFLIYGFAFVILMAMVAFIHEPTGKDAAQPTLSDAVGGGRFPYRAVAGFCAVTLFVSSIFYFFIIEGGLAFGEVGIHDPARLGFLISSGSLVVPLGAVLFGLLGRRAAAVQFSVLLLLLGAGMLGMGLAHTAPAMVASMLVQQVSTGMAVPLLIAWAIGRVPFDYRGVGMGAWASAFFLGQFICPLILALFRGVTGTVQGAFALAGLLSLLGAGAALIQVRRDTHAA